MGPWKSYSVPRIRLKIKTPQLSRHRPVGKAACVQICGDEQLLFWLFKIAGFRGFRSILRWKEQQCTIWQPFSKTKLSNAIFCITDRIAKYLCDNYIFINLCFQITEIIVDNRKSNATTGSYAAIKKLGFVTFVPKCHIAGKA